MESIHLQFGQGIEPPAKLGTVIIKPVSSPMMGGNVTSTGEKLSSFSYGQNIDTENDEFGNSVLLPGPALNNITGNGNLIGVPLLRSFSPNPQQLAPVIFLSETVYSVTSTVGGMVTNVNPGATPVLAPTTYSLSHSGHTNPRIDDMEFWGGAGANLNYSLGKDDTDQWLVSQAAGGGTYQNYVTLTSPGVLSLPANTFEQKLFLSKNDSNFYLGNSYNIDRYDPITSTKTDSVLGVGVQHGITAFEDWLSFLAIAVSTEYPFTFARRKGAGKSGIYLWDLTSSKVESRGLIPCPAHYISALKRAPDGTLIAFGGVNEGKTTLYQFNGYGFVELYTYIGDMPRNRHSVDFDGQGRILWQTVDGQICRYDIAKGIFNHLGTISTANSQGGILMRLLGGTGQEFLAASGNGTTYALQIMTFGNFVGDGDPGSDVYNTPLAVSGQVNLPQKSIIRNAIVSLNQNLTAGNKIEVRLYPNSNLTYQVIGTLDFSIDGAVASKQVRTLATGNDNAAIGLAWKSQDNSTTAPGVTDVELQYNKITTS